MHRYLVSGVLVVIGLGSALMCSGGGRNARAGLDAAAPVPPGKVSLGLVNDGPCEGLEEVHLKLAGLDLRQRGGPWVALPLASPDQAVEVMNPRGNPRRTLVAAAEVPDGTYEELRFRLHPGHWGKVRAGGGVREVKGPDTFIATGLQLRVKGGAAQEAVLTFPAAHAIRESPSGSGQFALHPLPVTLHDPSRTGAIRGLLTWPDGAPAAGVTVMAQRLGVAGRDTVILRTGTTRTDGAYELDLLPLGSTCCVVVPPGLDAARAHDLTVGQDLLPVAVPPPLCDLVLNPAPAQAGTVLIPGFPAFHPRHQIHEAFLLKREIRKGRYPAPWVVVDAHFPASEGPFAFKPVAPGIYAVQFHEKGWTSEPNRVETGEAWSDPFPVEVKPGEATEVKTLPAPRQSLKVTGGVPLTPDPKFVSRAMPQL